jgi:hypothetical protein
MTTEPGVRFGIANGLLVTTFLAASVVRLGMTGTAWVALLAAGLLGVGLSLSMTASLGVIAWAWFTGFVENRFGQLTFAGEDVQRLVVFTVSAVALSVFTRRAYLVTKETSHG